jgi:serine O-acetyltransferase
MFGMALPHPTIPRAESNALLRTFRAYQNARSVVARKSLAALFRVQELSSGCEIALTSRIGLGLALPHPTGIVIYPDAQIGINCCIFQHVTIGIRHESCRIRIGDGVEIGPHAQLLGDLSIGDGAVIGAGAVVANDVPAYHIAIGAPARTLRYREHGERGARWSQPSRQMRVGAVSKAAARALIAAESPPSN